MSPSTPNARLSIVRTVGELREALAAGRTQGRRIGLVPTMGALHEGHRALIARAHEQCELVVVSVFVNPVQFDEHTDLERYPRREREDAELAQDAGADLLFAPAVAEVYPAGFATSVEVSGALTERLEGEARGAQHFRGVATVVAKLLSMVAPDVAYFGEKDAQQLRVIRRLVRDLNLPVRIAAVATVRDRDGLALSSRNSLLSPAGRARAAALPAALHAARALAARGEGSAEALTGAAREAMRAFDVEPDYVALVDPDSFEALEALTHEGMLALAARVEDVRLIDNTILTPADVGEARAQARGGQRDGEPIHVGKGALSTCSG